MSDEEFPRYRLAKVISNDDSVGAPSYITAKTGCIKIKIYPELIDVADDDLPWAAPDSVGASGAASGIGVHNPPEVNSFIRVKINDPYMRELYYLGGVMAASLYPYSAALNKITIAGYTKPSYPEPRMIALPDGSVVFWDTTTGDMGIQQSKGSYVLFKSDGSGTVSTAGLLTVAAEGGTQTLGALIQQLISTLTSLTTFGPPVQHLISPTTVTALELIKTQFAGIIHS
jgi:hypothetical protein